MSSIIDPQIYNDLNGTIVNITVANDVAVDENGEQLNVGAQNRQRFFQFYVRDTDLKNEFYNMAQDGPQAQTWIIPTREELKDRTGRILVLCVGITFGSQEPGFYKLDGTGRKDAARDAARAQRGINSTDPKALRVVMSLTDYIAGPRKNPAFFVCCNLNRNTGELRRIHRDSVYFFGEYYEMITENSRRLKKSRGTGLTQAYKYAAAKHKSFEERAASIADEETSPDMDTNMEENTTNTPRISDSEPGMATLYTSETPITLANATIVLQELQTLAKPIYTNLTAEIIMKVHTALLRSGVGDSLSHQSTIDLLEHMAAEIGAPPTNWLVDWPESEINKTVTLFCRGLLLHQRRWD